VGVDIFFVISGYLITSIIYRDCVNQKFSLAKFYQRRISRIFPVFFMVSLSILITASILYSAQDFSSAGALSAASSLSLTNIKLMFQGNYFEVSPDAQPFLHFWSLSVEEQFYLFLPLTLFMTHKLRLSRKWLLVLLGTLAVGSLGACVVLTHTRPTWAFYLLPTRAWELLAGAMLAVMTARQVQPQAQKIDHWLSLLGLLLVGISFFVVTEKRAFPGYIALIPVLGSVLLIGRAHDKTQFTEVLLSNPILVFIGKISYSLYLWHWPVYCFVDYRLFAQPTDVRTAIKLGLTVALALMSYACIEKPVRVYLNDPGRKRIGFAGLGIGVVVFVAAGILIRQSNGYVTASLDQVADGGIAFVTSDTAPNVVLMGDSNASMYGRTMKDIAAQANVNVNVICVAAENPFPNTPLYESSMQFLASKKPQVTVFVAAWTEKIAEHHEKLTATLDELLKHTQHVVLITQAPVLPPEASREGIRQTGWHAIVEEPVFAAKRWATNAYLHTLVSDRIHVLDIESLFVLANGQIRFADKHGRELFRDKGHLSGIGAELVRPQLVNVITPLVNNTQFACQPSADPVQ
jgi:peptidoglycan/LPS O-acetylase OafA/YrhL